MEALKKFFKGLWTFLNSRIFVIILIVLLIMFAAGQCKRILDDNRELDIHKQNISALTDTLKYERNRNGDLVITIDGFISTVKDLKELNKNLAIEVQQQKGKVISLNTVVLRLRQDSAMLAKALDKANRIIGEFKQIDKNTYAADWTLPYRYDKNPKDSLNYDVFKGRTIVSISSDSPPIQIHHKDTYMVERNSSIYLAWGQKFEGNKLRIFVESPYPGLSAANMQGVLIDPSTWPNVIPTKKQHWFTGFGIGPNISTGWNVLQAKPALIIGVGIHYNIYEF